jgi:hypothetical protein
LKELIDMSQGKVTFSELLGVAAYPLGGLIGAILTVSLDRALVVVAQRSLMLRAGILIGVGLLAIALWQFLLARMSRHASESDVERRPSPLSIFARTLLSVLGTAVLLFGFVALLTPEASSVLRILAGAR